MPLYFAYGSNMDEQAMAKRCPLSRPLGPARLTGYRFVLMREGYASVAPENGGLVHGLLWDLALRDVAALDRYEAVAEGLYVKSEAWVSTPQGSRRALVYVGSNTGPGAARPGYMESVIAAACQAGLPQTYIAELARHLPRWAAGSHLRVPGGAHG